MRKLIVEEWISLDGYASDRNGKLDFFAPHVASSYESTERRLFRDEIDTLLMGSRTYAQFATLWPGRTADSNMLADKMNTAQKVVFSHSLATAPWGNWKAAEIEDGDMTSRVNQMKSARGGSLVVWGSISLAQAIMRAGLVDEYHIHVCPVLTGGGTKLFVENQPGSLELVSASQYGPGIMHLFYRKQ